MTTSFGVAISQLHAKLSGVFLAFYVTITRRCETEGEAQRFADKRTEPGDTVTLIHGTSLSLRNLKTGEIEKTLAGEGFLEAHTEALLHLGYSLEFTRD